MRYVLDLGYEIKNCTNCPFVIRSDAVQTVCLDNSRAMSGVTSIVNTESICTLNYKVINHPIQAKSSVGDCLLKEYVENK